MIYDQYLPSIDEIRAGPGLTSCPSLRACVDEITQIMPAGPSEMPQIVLFRGFIVDGNHIPEEATVSVVRNPIWHFVRNWNQCYLQLPGAALSTLQVHLQSHMQ